MRSWVEFELGRLRELLRRRSAYNGSFETIQRAG
jgi:hypothetical protein